MRQSNAGRWDSFQRSATRDDPQLDRGRREERLTPVMQRSSLRRKTPFGCGLAVLAWLSACSTATAPSVSPAAGSGETAGAGRSAVAPDPACVEPSPGALPDDVFCTGLYQGRDSSKYARGPVAYEPGVK